MNLAIFLIFLIILIILILIVLISNTYNRYVEYQDFGDSLSPYKICFIAGIHGNEPAASLLLRDMIKTDYFQRVAMEKGVFIRVIPAVNEFGLAFCIRFQNSISHPDINRTFAGDGVDFISTEMIRLTNEMSLIVDFHEGWGFHRVNPLSIGSTLTITNGMRFAAEQMVQQLNQTISRNEHHFMILDDVCRTDEKTLSCYSSRKGKEYILVETTGQNDIQPLDIRQEQIKIIISTLFTSLNGNRI